MDTNSNIPAEKKVVSVEILHLDELGYGPQGKHTRREWRKECLENLLAGKEQFDVWQKGLVGQIDNTHHVNNDKFNYKETFDDGFVTTIVAGAGEMQYALDFVGQTITDNLNFANIVFLHSVLFISVKFCRNVHFNSTSFNGNVNFRSAIFNDVVNFNSTIFNGETYFTSATFNGRAEFFDIELNKRAHFGYAQFNENAGFSNAKFNWFAYFDNATFKNDAYFTSTEFSEDASFRSTTFVQAANFFKAQFKNQCRFDNVQHFATKAWNKESRFGGAVDFESARFDNQGHFERVHFLKETPTFRGCKIGDTRLEFSDDSYFPKNENSEDAIKNISFLKRLAEEHGQTDQALNFNAMELRAKRKQVEPKPASWSFKAVTWLYEKVSDYGRSFLRPLLGYGALVICSILLTLPLSDYSQDTTPVAVANRALCVPKDKEEAAKQLQLTHGRAAFEYAMFRAGGVLDFTDTGKQNNTVNCALFGQPIEPPLMRAWGIFKGISSIALLFLAALGLRNKYRIR